MTFVGNCKLCHQTKTLLKSHYLPKGAYRVNRARELSNSNPVVLFASEAKQSQTQLKDNVLCSDCEERFNKNGENWVLANIPREYGAPFPLLNALSSLTPIGVVDDLKIYAGLGTPGVDIEKLIYFAMSLFWRGAVHSWGNFKDGRPTQVSLGNYEETIRQYLLNGSRLPKDVALTILVCPNGRKLNAIFAPWATAFAKSSRYVSYLSGIGFILDFGKDLPEEFRSLCAYHSPQRVLLVSPEFEQTIREVIKTEVEARGGDAKLKKMLGEIHTKRSKPSKP
jgi:hypothetical protein